VKIKRAHAVHLHSLLLGMGLGHEFVLEIEGVFIGAYLGNSQCLF